MVNLLNQHEPMPVNRLLCDDDPYVSIAHPEEPVL